MITAPLPVAILGFWHVHADDYARAVAEHPLTEIAVVWDDDEDRGRAAAARYGVPFERELEAVWARGDIVAATVTTSTAAHDEVIASALSAGVHVFTEKLLAATVDGAERLLALADAHGASLSISLPRLTEAATLTAVRHVRSGALGELTYARVRLAHNGSVHGWLPSRFYDRDAAIGGALTDLGCHAVYLSHLFLGGAPESVSAVYGHVTGEALEDNAVVTTRYASGAIGVIEASNVTTPGAFLFELRGTAGTIIYGIGGERMIAKGDAFDPEQWIELELDAASLGPFERWISAIHSREPDRELQDAALALTRLVVAANESAASGRAIEL